MLSKIQHLLIVKRNITFWRFPCNFFDDSTSVFGNSDKINSESHIYRFLGCMPAPAFRRGGLSYGDKNQEPDFQEDQVLMERVISHGTPSL
jgi:hypothetical protein